MADLTLLACQHCSGYVIWVIDSPRISDKSLLYLPAVEFLLVKLSESSVVQTKTPLIWHKNGPPGGPYYPGHDYEQICVFHNRDFKPPPLDLSQIGTPAKFDSGRGCQRTASGGRTRSKTGVKKGQLSRPRDVLRFTVGKNSMGRPGNDGKVDKRDDSLATSGEAPYPWKLADYLVRGFSQPLDLVCDPFSGTGTTMLAAIMNDRDFIGSDIRESQIKIAKKRRMLWQSAQKNSFFPRLYRGEKGVIQ
jgi:hypothetical protein